MKTNPHNLLFRPSARTREEAIEQGISRYHGKPCKYGHPGLHYTNGHCVYCLRERNARRRQTKTPSNRMVELDHLKPEPTWEDDYY